MEDDNPQQTRSHQPKHRSASKRNKQNKRRKPGVFPKAAQSKMPCAKLRLTASKAKFIRRIQDNSIRPEA